MADDEGVVLVPTEPNLERAAATDPADPSHRVVRVFVLDVGPRSGIRDQHLQLGNRRDADAVAAVTGEGIRSRIESQVVAMKLLCCAALPDRVGVVHMGATPETVRVDLAPTQGWRCATDDDGNPVDGVLANYFVAPSAAGPPTDRPRSICALCAGTPEREGADPDPGRAERIVHALDTCLETISESVTDVDLDERETTTEVTVFLCSPPVDLRYCAEEVDRIKHLMWRQNIALDFILHPSAYSPDFDSGFAHPSSPLVQPFHRCTSADVRTLESALIGTRLDFRVYTPAENFVSTVCAFNDYYLGRCEHQVRKSGPSRSDINRLSLTSSLLSLFFIHFFCSKMDAYNSWLDCYRDNGGGFPITFWTFWWHTLSDLEEVPGSSSSTSSSSSSGTSDSATSPSNSASGDT